MRQPVIVKQYPPALHFPVANLYSDAVVPDVMGRCHAAGCAA